MLPTNTAREKRRKKEYENKARPFLEDRRERKIEELEARLEEIEE